MKRMIAVITCLFVCATARAEVVVIVNAANSAAVSQEDVERLFLKKQSEFTDGTSATPYYLTSGNASRDEFSQAALGKSPQQLKAYWSKLVFTGKGQPPEELADSAAAVAKVASDKSAIAYCDPAAVNDSVRVVATYP